MNEEVKLPEVATVDATQEPVVESVKELSPEQLQQRELLAAMIEMHARRELKKLQKQRIWYNGNLVSHQVWDALDHDERLRSNNIIRK
jgi:hypothetical protein